MTDVAIQDGHTPVASSPMDARPSSAGSAGQSGAFELAQPSVFTDELKGRLDKIIYSDVSLGKRD